MVYQIEKHYSWNVNLFKVSAEIVGAEMEKIEKRDGEVTPKALLEEARSTNSPIHNLFDWNDTTAAEKYRLSQAGLAIRQIKVQIVRVPNEVKEVKLNIEKTDSTKEKHHIEEVNMRKAPTGFVAPIRAFVNIADSRNRQIGHNQGKFVNVITATENEESRKQVLLNALDELHRFQKKYEQYCEFASLFADIRRIESEINAGVERKAAVNE